MRVLYTTDGFIYINMSLEVSLKDYVLMLRVVLKLYFVCNPCLILIQSPKLYANTMIN